MLTTASSPPGDYFVTILATTFLRPWGADEEAGLVVMRGAGKAVCTSAGRSGRRWRDAVGGLGLGLGFSFFFEIVVGCGSDASVLTREGGAEDEVPARGMHSSFSARLCGGRREGKSSHKHLLASQSATLTSKPR